MLFRAKLKDATSSVILAMGMDTSADRPTFGTGDATDVGAGTCAVDGGTVASSDSLEAASFTGVLFMMLVRHVFNRSTWA